MNINELKRTFTDIADAIRTKRGGKVSNNLFNDYTDSYVRHGVTIINNNDGTFTLNGTNTVATDLYLSSTLRNPPFNDYSIPIYANEWYVGSFVEISGSYSGSANPLSVNFSSVNADGENYVSNAFYSGTPKQATEDGYVTMVRTVARTVGTTFNNWRIGVQFETGRLVTPFEPHNPPSPTYQITEFAKNINLITTGSTLQGDIKFIDYKGNDVICHTFDEILNSTRLPEPPDFTQNGLVFDKWNFTLEELKEYAQQKREVIVGALYLPVEGDLVVDVEITSLENNIMNITAYNQGVININWGDGTVDTIQPVTTATPYSHTYTELGLFKIILTKQDDSSLSLGTGTVGDYQNICYNPDNIGLNARTSMLPVEISIRNTMSFYGGGFQCFRNLKYVNIESGFTMRNNMFKDCNVLICVILSNVNISSVENLLYNCKELKYLSIDNNFTEIPTACFYNNYNLKEFYFTKNVNVVKENAFNGCINLKSIDTFKVITIEPYGFANCTSLEKLDLGIVRDILDYAFYGCKTIERIILPEMTIGTLGVGCFESCENLQYFKSYDGSLPLPSRMFLNCYSLKSVEFIRNPYTINTNTFANCYTLENFPQIEGDVVQTGCFSSCKLLRKYTIPANVITVEQYSFNNCVSLVELTLLPTKPPVLRGTQTFENHDPNLVIYVPQGSLEAYQTATNWSFYADYMQERG